MELCTGLYPVMKESKKAVMSDFVQCIGIRYFARIIQWLSQSFFSVVMDSLSLLPFIVFTVTLQFQLIRNHAGMDDLICYFHGIRFWKLNKIIFHLFTHNLFSLLFLSHFFLFFFLKIGSITPNRTWFWKDYSRNTEIAL